MLFHKLLSYVSIAQTLQVCVQPTHIHSGVDWTAKLVWNLWFSGCLSGVCWTWKRIAIQLPPAFPCLHLVYWCCQYKGECEWDDWGTSHWSSQGRLPGRKGQECEVDIWRRGVWMSHSTAVGSCMVLVFRKDSLSLFALKLVSSSTCAGSSSVWCFH